jgi:hypothetical protein
VEADPLGWLTLVRQHFIWYPFMQLQDVYKLLYQGVMGPEHMAPSKPEFISQLQAEFEGLIPNPHQPILEPIHADMKLFRVNLRAYKSLNPSVGSLIPLFLNTFGLTLATRADLVDVWLCVVKFIDQGQLDKFTISGVRQYQRWLENKNYPAVHHSTVYRQHYQPSYRLISAQFIDLLGVPDAS